MSDALAPTPDYTKSVTWGEIAYLSDSKDPIKRGAFWAFYASIMVNAHSRDSLSVELANQARKDGYTILSLAEATRIHNLLQIREDQLHHNLTGRMYNMWHACLWGMVGAFVVGCLFTLLVVCSAY